MAYVNTAAFTAAYALSRIDLVPDFIPMPRYPDDLLLLPLSAAMHRKANPAARFLPHAVHGPMVWSVE